MVSRLVAGVLAARLLLPVPAAAADHPQEALKLVLVQNPITGRAKVVWVSKTPRPVLPVSPPTSVGGAFVVGGVDQRLPVALPKENWRANAAGTLWKFANGLAPAGNSPCKVALIKEEKILKVVCKSSVIRLDDTAQGTVSVALAIGTDVYCSVCTTAIRDEPGRFIAKACETPVGCPADVRPCGDVDGICGGACPENSACFAIGVGCHGEPEPCRCHATTTTCPATSTSSTTSTTLPGRPPSCAGVLQACGTDTDCPAGYACGGDGMCRAGSCDRRADCPGGGECVFPPAGAPGTCTCAGCSGLSCPLGCQEGVYFPSCICTTIEDCPPEDDVCFMGRCS